MTEHHCLESLAVAAIVAIIAHSSAYDEFLKEVKLMIKQLDSRCHQEMSDPMGTIGSKARWFALCKTIHLFTCDLAATFWASLILGLFIFDVQMFYTDWRGTVLGVFSVMGVANLYLAVFWLLRGDKCKRPTNGQLGSQPQ